MSDDNNSKEEMPAQEGITPLVAFGISELDIARLIYLLRKIASGLENRTLFVESITTTSDLSVENYRKEFIALTYHGDPNPKED